MSNATTPPIHNVGSPMPSAHDMRQTLIDEAVIEANRKWQADGKPGRFSTYLANTLAVRLESATLKLTRQSLHTMHVAATVLDMYADFIKSEVNLADIERHPYLPELEGTADELRELLSQHMAWRPATEADRAKPVRAVRWRADEHCPWIYHGRIQAESLPANDIERCQVKQIGTRDPAQALRENTMRVERIVMLDTMLGDQLYPAQALEHLMQEETDTLLSLFPGMPDWLRKELIDDVEFEDAFIEWVNQESVSGLAVQFATPVMKWGASGESSTYSWSHYNTRWFYADSMDEAIAMALSWAYAIRQAEKSNKGAA